MSASASASASSSNDNNNSSSAAGKCPVDHETRSLWGLLGKTKTSAPTTNSAASVPESSPLASEQTLPASVEEAARHAQTPLPGQRLPLSTHRAESSIPRSNSNNNNNNNSNSNKHNSNNNSNSDNETSLPSHQVQWKHPHGDAATHNTNTIEPAAPNWVYPSEQQVFNAMKRKGWKGIEEESIPSFLRIHNSVNERSWKQVLEWETGNANANGNGNSNGNASSVELSRFEGRPTDLTPKAWLLSTLGICDKPFDRHDWYVVNRCESASGGRGNPEEKRYVLDFYMRGGDDNEGSVLPRVEIDVRPALDTPGAVFQRGIRLLREAFPGMAREWDDRERSRRSASD